jgi:hypothetical protein
VEVSVSPNPIEPEPAVPITHEEPAATVELRALEDSISGLLCDPGGVRLRGAAADVHPPAAQLDEESTYSVFHHTVSTVQALGPDGVLAKERAAAAAERGHATGALIRPVQSTDC